ncbi:MAG: peptide chain release factor N(5)-glutamine methyltransferase [Planctomycetaceae bacterium]|nr:peptide chain release factor N(5)-glutamine methyltransferase [Planctomycetaceae bacterium]
MSANATNPADTWTIRRVLEWTTGYLSEHGSESPRLEAEILLAYAKQCPRIQLYTHFDDELSDEVRGRMRALVKRRADLEPVAYLVGHREFFSLDFEVNRDVLIPRPETELLVMEALEALKAAEVSGRVLDIGTGSGCIAIAIAHRAPTAAVTAVDISESALVVARRNAERHNVADRVSFLQGDLFAPLGAGEEFDVIVSNPPYVSTDDQTGLEQDVVRHEPHGALFAGRDGLDVIRRIIDTAPQHLRAGGSLFLEFSPEQADSIVALLHASGQFEGINILRDTSHQQRAVRAKRVD